MVTKLTCKNLQVGGGNEKEPTNLINEIEPSVIKKADDFVSFKFGSIQCLAIMKFFGGATWYSFLKHTKPVKLNAVFSDFFSKQQQQYQYRIILGFP